MFIASYEQTMAGAKPKFKKASPEALAMEKFLGDSQKIAVQRAIKKREQAVAEAEEAIAEYRALLSSQGKFQHTFETIERRVCRALGYTPRELRSRRRNRELVFARHAVMYWAARLTRLSLPQIGRLLGGKDHTTVIFARRSYPQKRAEMGRHLKPAR